MNTKCSLNPVKNSSWVFFLNQQQNDPSKKCSDILRVPLSYDRELGASGSVKWLLSYLAFVQLSRTQAHTVPPQIHCHIEQCETDTD